MERIGNWGLGLCLPFVILPSPVWLQGASGSPRVSGREALKQQYAIGALNSGEHVLTDLCAKPMYLLLVASVAPFHSLGNGQREEAICARSHSF